jgi:hypothetical protein
MTIAFDRYTHADAPVNSLVIGIHMPAAPLATGTHFVERRPCRRHSLPRE